MGRILLSIALIAGLSGVAFGQTTPASEIAPGGKLRVGMIASPVLGGVAAPVARFIAQKLGVAFEPVMYPNPGAYLQSFGKGEWDIAIGPRVLAPADKADSTPDLWVVSLVYVAAPGQEFPDTGSVDKAGVKIGTIRGSLSDRVLTRDIKAAEIIRIPLSPTVAADAAELLRSGKADVFGADAGVDYPAAKALPGAKIVPGAFATVRVAAALPKGRSAAAQAALATLVKEAIDAGTVDRAFEAHGRLDGVVAQAFDAQGRLEGVMRARDEGPPPERLIIGSSDSNASLPSDAYDDEDVEHLVQKCVADAAQDAEGWSKKDIEEATRKQCAARKRHVEAYEALQGNYRTLMGLLAQDIRTNPADAGAQLRAMVKACIDHKSDVSTGGHNIMVDVIENDIAAKCLALGANLLRDEIRELVTNECVPGVPGSC
jgi:polar amino acid transport system substrate-binding protein